MRLIALTTIALTLAAAIAHAQAPDPAMRLQRDWGAMEVAQAHVLEDVSTLVRDGAAARDAEARLKWVLDNWVKPDHVAPKHD